MSSAARSCSACIQTLLLCLAAACGEAESAVPPSDATVANATSAWAAGDAWRVAEAPRVLIGETSGERAYEFAGVVAALRLSDGRIVVADRASREIRWFSAAGEHVRTAGGKGGGPGEFMWINWMGVRGDSVVAWDSYHTRVGVYDPGGRLAREVRVEGLGAFPNAMGMMEGALLLLPSGEFDDFQSRPDGEHVDSVSYVRVDLRDGRVAGRVGPYLHGEKFKATHGNVFVGEYVVFGRRGVIATSSGGFYTAETGRFTATAHAADGTPLRRFGRPHASVRASSQDVEAETARLSGGRGEMARLQPGMGEAHDLLVTRITHRATLPAILRVLVDGEENVWMEEFRIDREAAPAWSVFDAQGRWLGRVTTPAGLDVRQIGGGWITGVTRDEDGIERVAVYELRR